MEDLDAILRDFRHKRDTGALTAADFKTADALRSELEDLLLIDSALSEEISQRTGRPCTGGEQGTPDELLRARGAAAYARISESWRKKS